MPAKSQFSLSTSRATWCALFALAVMVPEKAHAQGKVTKQKACKVQVEPLQKATVGQSAVLTMPDGKKYNGKLTVFKAPRGVVDVVGDAEKKCPALVGATVELGAAKGKAKATKPGAGTTPPADGTAEATPPAEGAPPKKPMFGVTLFGGWSSINLKRPEGSSSSLPYGGFDFGGGGRYYLNLGEKVTIPFELGLTRFSNEVKVQSLDNATQLVSDYSIALSSMQLRLGAGLGYYAMPALRLQGLLHFDYGFSAKLAYSGKHGRDKAERALKSLMRYGLVAGLDYAVFKGLTLGAEGAFFMGSATEAEKDPALTGTAFSLTGYGGGVRFGYDF